MSATNWTPPASIEITLRRPVEHAGKRYAALVLRKPLRAALQVTLDRIHVGMTEGDMTEFECRLIALCARIPIAAVDEMDVDDGRRVFKACGEFYGPSEE